MKDLNSEVVKKAADNMRKRYRFSYSIFDLVYNFLVPVKVFCCCKGSRRNLHSRYLLYRKVEDKFAQEFDAVEFARSQRKLKMLIHWLMDKSERFLTAYQKSNAISMSTESDSLSDDPAYTKIPKMLASSKTKQKHVVQVNRFFEEYLKEIHNGKDINLLHGIYSTKENNNNQQEVADLFKDIDNNEKIGTKNEKLNGYVMNRPEESKENLFISSNKNKMQNHSQNFKVLNEEYKKSLSNIYSKD